MKHLSKTVMSIAIAVFLGLSYSNAIADPGAGGNEGMNQSEDADLDRIQPDDPDQDRLQSDDPDQDRLEDGDQSGTVEKEEMVDYRYRYEEPQSSEGLAVDQNLQPGQTDTHFRAWLSSDENVTENGGLYQGNRVQLGSELSVDKEDVGKTVECLVVAQYKTHEEAAEQVFMLADNGWEVWSGNVAELAGAQCQLGELHRIQALEGEVMSGVFKLHFGYQLEDGAIVVSPVPVSFTVNE